MMLLKQIEGMSNMLIMPRSDVINLVKLEYKSKNNNNKIEMDDTKVIPIDKIHLLENHLYMYF
jgi:hypothetical protein